MDDSSADRDHGPIGVQTINFDVEVKRKGCESEVDVDFFFKAVVVVIVHHCCSSSSGGGEREGDTAELTSGPWRYELNE